MQKENVLALFDFDGTIIKKDSLLHFTRYALGRKKFIIGLIRLAPMLLQFKMKRLNNTQAKERFLRYFFRGWPENEFYTVARRYALNTIDRLVRPRARARLSHHQKQGHRIVVVSASLQAWLQPWCDKNNFELIAGKAETQNGRLTGRLALPNCYGAEKVRRLHEKYDLKACSTIFAYGDSRGDKEMLEIADHAFLNFKELKH